MEQLSNKLGVLRDYVSRVEDKAVKSVKDALRASPLIVAMLSGCALDSASSQPKQQGYEPEAVDLSGDNSPAENANTSENADSQDEKMIYMALWAGEGETVVSTPVFNSPSVLRVVIQDKYNPDNFVIALAGDVSDDRIDAQLPQVLPKGHVAVLSAYVEDSCNSTPESISSLDQLDCEQEVVMVDVDKKAEQCEQIKADGNLCSIGNDEAPVPYAW